MTGRLDGKRAILVGAGFVSAGIGNGRATAMLFAREGAKVLAVDCNLDAANDTVARIHAEEGEAEAALFLASYAAGFITGAVLPVDGGMSA